MPRCCMYYMRAKLTVRQSRIYFSCLTPILIQAASVWARRVFPAKACLSCHAARCACYRVRPAFAGHREASRGTPVAEIYSKNEGKAKRRDRAVPRTVSLGSRRKVFPHVSAVKAVRFLVEEYFSDGLLSSCDDVLDVIASAPWPTVIFHLVMNPKGSGCKRNI